MTNGKWFITPHAVHRYMERIDRRATHEQALAELIRYSEVARPIKEIAPGVMLFRSGRPLRLRFRVAVDSRSPYFVEGGMPQLITVVTGHDAVFRRIDERGRFVT
jgi:hypothetical protein